jgi:tellurite resistance protein TerC
VAGHWLEIGCAAIVLGMLLGETLRFHRNPHALSLREALLWSLGWMVLAALFGLGVYFQHGPEKALEFGVGYVIEWSLSLDNLFVFVAIFSAFAVPEGARHRGLLWGIVGAVILRGVFIAAGAALLAHFEWILDLFGAFLVVTGWKLLRQPDAPLAPDRNPVLRLFRRLIAVTPEYHGQRFFVRRDGRWLATPLVPVLIAIGTTDILFATDSIPAIFGITRDPFIVATSNIFAVLGLRGLFFLLSGMLELFRYLKLGLAGVLVFVGVKLLLADVFPVSAGASLAVVGGVLAVSVAASLLRQLWRSPARPAGPWSDMISPDRPKQPTHWPMPSRAAGKSGPRRG